jgi:beta-1,4-galactosyltransferase 1
VDLNETTIIEIEKSLKYISLKLGGEWSPSTCKARYKVAIIVPYRKREKNLNIFLRHMHPFLSKQLIEYGIFVVEPLPELTFNRGLLMNIGYLQSLNISDNKWDCFMFHDVDLIPEDERNIYSCPEAPRHMSSAVSTFNYKLPYTSIFGGVSSLTKEQMKNVNGYSNLYFGWGGEGTYIYIYHF